MNQSVDLLLLGDNLEALDPSSMNRCPKPNPVSCSSYIDDSVLDLIHFDNDQALSALLKKNPNLLSARDGKGQTLLHIAAIRNRHQCVHALLQSGSNALAVENESGWTPLHAALYRGSLVAAKILLQQKTVPTSILDNEGNAPFDLVLSKSETPGRGLLRSRHILVSFGSPNNLQLGVVSDSLSRNRPKFLDALLNEDILNFDLCEIGGAAVSASGSVFSWGVNKNARLGVGDDTSRIRPEPVPLPPGFDRRCVAVAVSLTHSVFLLSNGEVYTCGKGYLGHDPIGKGQQQSSIPRRVEKGLKRINVVNISCSKFRTCLVTDSGEALLLGYHMADEGIDYVPNKIEGLSNIHVARMLTTNGHWIAQSMDGDLYEQTRRERRFIRVPISRISKRNTNRPAVTDFATCKSHSVAVTSDGTLWAWPSRAIKGDAPDPASRPTPRQVKAVRGVVAVKASVSVDHSAVITVNGDLIEWEHGVPSAPAPGQYVPSDWLPARNDKVTRLSHPRQLDQVKCAPGCTLVSQELRLFDHNPAPTGSSKQQIPTLFRMCEIAVCSTIDERRAIAAFRFAFNIHSQYLLDHCADFIIGNSPALLFNAIRELGLNELEYLQERYWRFLPNSILQYARNEKPLAPASTDDALELEWFVPHTVRHLRTKIRSSLKKMSQIAILADRLSNGEMLNPEQLHKLKQKDRLRLFLQQCQGELASKLEPDPVIEFIQPSESDTSEPREIVTVTRAQSRHTTDGWNVDSLLLPGIKPPGQPKRTKLAIGSEPVPIANEALEPQAQPEIHEGSQSSLSRDDSQLQITSTGTLKADSVVKSTLSYALASSRRDLTQQKQSNAHSQAASAVPTLPSSSRPVAVNSPGLCEKSVGRRSNHKQSSRQSSVSLADFLSNTPSSPINIKAPSKTRSSKVNQEFSPVSTGSPWNTAGVIRAKSLSEIQNEHATANKARAIKNMKETRPPWASHSPPVASFADIIQEEMAMKLQFPDQSKAQVRSCWGLQNAPLKPSSIESIQSLQFIQEELDRETQEQARAIEAFNRNRNANCYQEGRFRGNQQCRRQVTDESSRRGGVTRRSARLK